MSHLDEGEQEAVLAHELSHVKNRDVMVLTWASLIVIMAALFGRTKLRKAKRDGFLAAITAAFSLMGRTDLRPTEKAGIVFNPVESSFFDNLESELPDLLRISGKATGTGYEIADDRHCAQLVVLDDRDVEDLVSTIHLVGETITKHGFGDRLLAAVLRFDYEGRRAYWVYNNKLGRHYPFVLAGEKQRDNAAEMKLAR